MRDVKRLEGFYENLRTLHEAYVPDWRFGQFMVNMINALGDPFYWEEDEFIERVEEYLRMEVGVSCDKRN